MLDFDKAIYILILCFVGFFQVVQLAASQFHLSRLMDVHLQQASPDANLSSYVQTTQKTSTITDSVVYILYHIIRSILYIILYIYQIPICSTVMTKMEASKATNIPHKQEKKSPALCSAENPHLRIYVAGAPVGFFPQIFTRDAA